MPGIDRLPRRPDGKTTLVTAEQEELEVEPEAPTATGSLRMSSPTQWPENLPERIAAIKLLLPELGPNPEPVFPRHLQALGLTGG